MNKFDRVLSEEEVDNIVKNTTMLLGQSITRSKDFILNVEQAVLQSPEIQALRRDAGRYRWLRDGNGYYPEENYLRGGVELDDAIDAAMEQKK